MARSFQLRHGRAWPGQPRLAVPNVEKSWPGLARPAMTRGNDPGRQERAPSRHFQGFGMTDVLLQILLETWEILTEASIFLLVGYLIAGALAVLVPKGLFTRLLGTGKVRSVLWASVIGIPLPLCSCGVVPTAIGLRRQGATSGATVAFLVATPETGIDSISLTYALLDPRFALARPVAAMLTAVAAGLATERWGRRRGSAGSAAP